MGTDTLSVVSGGCSKRFSALNVGERYVVHADRKTSGVHSGQAGEPMQKPSFN